MAEIPIGDLPPWVRKNLDLRTNVAQWPLESFTVRPFGAFGAVRSKPSQGLCGPKPGEPTVFDSLEQEQRVTAARWPCKHYGADLSAPEGSKVVAPHDGWVLYIGPADKPPFRGYGPGVALIAHKDIASNMWRRVWRWATGPLVDIFDFPEEAVSGTYSLIGHINLLPGSGVPLADDVWGSINAKPDPDHWRRLKKDEDHIAMMSDAAAVTDARKVFAGQQIGTVSDKGHIHWELRKAPLADHAGRFDPIETFMKVYGLKPPGKVAQASGGGGGIGLLLAALLLGSKRKRRRR